MHAPRLAAPLCLALLMLLLAAPAAAQVGPSAEDRAALAPLLVGRVDVEPENIVHVAPLPGADGDGSAASPRRDLIRVVAEADAGTAIHLAPGIYNMSAIRDAFGHATSRLITNRDGQSGRPIVMRTDPARYVAGSAVAVLDFNYENEGDWSSSAFVARNDYWVFERFEMRRMHRRGFAVDGRECTLRELELHHADSDGSGNDALIVMMTSGSVANNVVLGNHLHHVGVIDTATDTVLNWGGVNGGCYYSVTRLTYDSGTPAAGSAATRAEWEAALEPADGDVYVVGNHVHDCHYGLGLKNDSRGPYYFWSNYIHDTDIGVFSPFRETYVRNNVIYDVEVGIQLGRAYTDGPLQTFLKMTGNGSHSEVSFNTIVRASQGMQFLTGWGTVVHHNLVVETSEPVAIQRNQFSWWEDGAWPGVRGEFLVGDMNSSHPFYDLVPGYARETPDDFRAMALTQNCYAVEPVIAAADFVQPVADITGMTFDRDYTVLTPTARAALFVAESDGDFQRRDDGLECGAWLAGTVTPPADGGVSIDGGARGDAGVDSDASAGRRDSGAATEPSPGAPSGCACTAGAPHPASPGLGWIAIALAAFAASSRRRRRAAALAT